ncbi:uncharacterized protein LOC120083787 [Benincasa hispida]|uniref:uncharacterized protein LOC120083787 n=1 Tax=Benincasa hispida TaxID=102211 RepID=UPI0019002AC9|nr:uncharacterized protein LOC120083787 [Benincasa hispida]
MCSEISSPRISFSYNLVGDGSLPIDQHVEYRRRDVSLLDSNLDFEFNISIEDESSCADELFSNGIILPIKIQSHKQSHPSLSLPPLPPPTQNSKQITLVNSSSSSSSSSSDHQLEQRVSESKSFWGFKRSNSLNNFESRRISLCPIPLLSRSNSTGSVSNSKSKKFKDSQKQIPQKQNSSSMKKSSSPSLPPSLLNQYPTILRTQMCKNPGGVYGNYHYIGPVLNVPPKFFGFGSLLVCGKDKKSKK